VKEALGAHRRFVQKSCECTVFDQDHHCLLCDIPNRQLRSDTVKRCYFGLWRLCLLQKWQDDGWQGTLAQVDNEISSVADGNVRKVVDSCVNLVQDILHQPGLHQRLQGQHQRGQYSPPTSTSLGDALSQPPWHLLGEDFRGHRVLARDVGSQPRSQTQREVQDVLLDILATYEKILLNETDFDRIDGLDETNDKWESNSLSSWSADEGLTGGEGSLTGVDGGKGGYVGRDGERNTAGSTYLVKRFKRFCQSVQQSLEEQIALTGQLERSLADCVCSEYT